MRFAINKHNIRRTCSLVVLSAALAVLGLGVRPAQAANIPITWIDMSPILLNGTVPSGSVFTVPGIGNVTLTYTMNAPWNRTRNQSPPNVSGSIVFGADTYSWTNYEYFGTIFLDGELGPEFATLTWTFPSTLPAGTVFVGSIGLGATTSFGGGASTYTVPQNGTFVGDYVYTAGYGPTLFTSSAGTFTVKNSLTGAGGADPWWNTYLGISRIDDAVSSLTVTHGLLRGDGVGINIGFKIPGSVGVEPRTWSGVKGLFQ